MTQTKKNEPAPAPPAKGAPQAPENGNEGEGSRTGTRRYDAGAERMASNPKRVEELAREAAEALDGPEGDELRAAEEKAKKVGKLP